MFKLFCKHQWKLLSEENLEYKSYKIEEETRYWFNPVVNEVIVKRILKIFACEKCGKTKTISVDL